MVSVSVSRCSLFLCVSSSEFLASPSRFVAASSLSLPLGLCHCLSLQCRARLLYLSTPLWTSFALSLPLCFSQSLALLSASLLPLSWFWSHCACERASLVATCFVRLFDVFAHAVLVLLLFLCFLSPSPSPSPTRHPLLSSRGRSLWRLSLAAPEVYIVETRW